MSEEEYLEIIADSLIELEEAAETDSILPALRNMLKAKGVTKDSKTRIGFLADVYQRIIMEQAVEEAFMNIVSEEWSEQEFEELSRQADAGGAE